MVKNLSFFDKVLPFWKEKNPLQLAAAQEVTLQQPVVFTSEREHRELHSLTSHSGCSHSTNIFTFRNMHRDSLRSIPPPPPGLFQEVDLCLGKKAPLQSNECQCDGCLRVHLFLSIIWFDDECDVCDKQSQSLNMQLALVRPWSLLSTNVEHMDEVPTWTHRRSPRSLLTHFWWTRSPEPTASPLSRHFNASNTFDH